jgi:hypothetical protein
MLQQLFFGLALANNILLIVIFVVRKRPERPVLRWVGIVYLLLALPAAFGLYLALREGAVRHAIFIGIFLAFLALEALYDFVLQVPFRESRDWRLLAPYLALYYAMNYGFVVLVWKASLPGGILMLVLFAAQIAINIATHPRKRKEKA